MSNETPRPVTLGEWRREHLPGTPHKALWDAEVNAFVNSRLQVESFTAVAQECLERFGPLRAPSKSALHRYWDKYIRTDEHDRHRAKRRRKPRAAR